MSKLQKIFLIASIILFIASLAQDTYGTGTNYVKGDSPGFFILLMGWIGIFYGGAGMCWIANPLLLLSWIFAFTKNSKISLILSLVATVACISFFFFKEIITDEAGHYGKITYYFTGYWLWVASASIMFTGNLILFLYQKMRAKSH